MLGSPPHDVRTLQYGFPTTRACAKHSEGKGHPRLPFPTTANLKAAWTWPGGSCRNAESACPE